MTIDEERVKKKSANLTDQPSQDWRLRMSELYDSALGHSSEDHHPCAGLRADLKNCLLASDCVRKLKKTPRECLKLNDGSVPEDCIRLRQTFFECKRSLLDNRQRFRGRKGY